ncbi:hypothetical protein IM543_11410 [Massilia sp. UMI-21]|nr:hypothetical protein IM543_11410 [Massilia sp. UMI-21]
MNTKGRPSAAGYRPSRFEQIAARDTAIETYEARLQDGPKPVGDLFEGLPGNRATLRTYLTHMHVNLRMIRVVSEPGIRPALWALGADPALPSHDPGLDEMIAPKRGIHKAVQIGIPRDPLIAALFGPANQEHKEAA